MNNNSSAIVVRSDTDAAPPSSSSGVVLDALPYVEHLDPNYEQYAVSLIEEELQDVVAEQQHRQRQRRRGDDENNEVVGEHPSLGRLLPASSKLVKSGDDDDAAMTTMCAAKTPDFGGRAPMATAAYDALAARRANTAGDNDDADTASSSFSIRRPDPMAGDKNDNKKSGLELESDLRTSIATLKIELEQDRHRHTNLELHRLVETPAKYTAYATKLESAYLDPTRKSVERRRRIVDGINATRMEEQERCYGGKLSGMVMRWEDRHTNLELHRLVETPAKYTAYATKLESAYLDPTRKSVERRRRIVDGINATRMEEQERCYGGKLSGMVMRWEDRHTNLELH
eukprot:CAMPEP_0181104856 /NCGR_PEP_ID=MMETSP1071-20121207/15657_1 /TAXON_ID=35127 /ORGANISM="Thalassiosira sp., Strain NH16" /LENGTH=342 /DNA_ID=CAMNT_0023188095 /DNA_START=85 /DNA_END=1110 /DNA_ORIENTATION=-